MPEATDVVRAIRARQQIKTRTRAANGRVIATPLVATEGLPRSRAEALASGALHYYTGRSCCRGHKAARWASSGNCLACLKERHPRRRSTAEKRKRLDDNTYTTGRPCIRGHLAPRRFSNGNCLECDRIKARDKSAILVEARNARARERYVNDPAYRARREAQKTPEWYERAKRKKRERYREDPIYRKRILGYKKGKDQRHNQLRTNYGITMEDYQAMLSAQNGVCAICRCRPDHTLHVDHDHRTGLVRGLLCRNCNRGIGCLRDDLDLLRNAVEYLGNAIK